MKILITGIAGFIGMHIALRLQELGHTVMGFDNLNSYYDPELKLERVEVLKEKGINFWKADLTDAGAMYDIVAQTKPEMVIHLAAMAGVRYSMDHADEYITTNVLGTLNLIRACESNDVENVIYASTSCVMHGNELPWGEPEYLYPQINPYGYTKAITESQFHISKIPNAVGLRFFTVYGPWGRPDMALFDFTKNILAGNPITLFNNGDMYRDFTYIDDVTAANIACSLPNCFPHMGRPNVGTGEGCFQIYNVGTGRNYSINDVAKLVAGTEDVTEVSVNVPLRRSELLETKADIQKFSNDTFAAGWSPKHRLEDVINSY